MEKAQWGSYQLSAFPIRIVFGVALEIRVFSLALSSAHMKMRGNPKTMK